MRINNDSIRAENLKLRATLARAVRDTVIQNRLTQVEAAERLGISQPRVSALLKGKADTFRVDSLVNMALRLGLNVSLEVRSNSDVDVLTPEGVLDRMCDAAMRKDTVAFMDDVQLFWRKQWDLAWVADPHEKEALKYALKACFLERMAEVWAEPPKSQPMSAPDWCRSVPPVQKEFSVIPDEYREFYEGDLISPIFGKRNIFAPRDFMFFV
ncbi:helix-turn-helix transcriptional regulator [uncultured Microbulbifer sp.]|uniref:helix-turn-helix domain-containing protein n=1 Tax=uncultured Microbulbifer sp. TaxID=348147 RepID=UPI0026179F79|nr:helix-turn-helix transcriptional regulator [uncultured Microbulbifer sp.]